MDEATVEMIEQAIELLTSISKDLTYMDDRLGRTLGSFPLPVNHIFLHFANHYSDANKACIAAVKQLDSLLLLQTAVAQLDNLSTSKLSLVMGLDCPVLAPQA
jgi:hypothetical protein